MRFAKRWLTSFTENYEIDIGELLAIFWFHKTLITVVTAVSVFIAGYYVLKTENYILLRLFLQFKQVIKTTLI